MWVCPTSHVPGTGWCTCRSSRRLCGPVEFCQLPRCLNAASSKRMTPNNKLYAVWWDSYQVRVTSHARYSAILELMSFLLQYLLLFSQFELFLHLTLFSVSRSGLRCVGLREVQTQLADCSGLFSGPPHQQVNIPTLCPLGSEPVCRLMQRGCFVICTSSSQKWFIINTSS